VNVAERDEKALMEAVALYGPVSVLMNAAREGFKFYSEGVFYDPDCGEVGTG
jgi:cathepsin L